VIQELWHAESEDRVVNTTALKSQIQRFTPRFMGYCQQDAQEFLRYLLEGLHEDVNRVTVKPKPNLADVDDQLKWVFGIKKPKELSLQLEYAESTETVYLKSIESRICEELVVTKFVK